MAVGTNAPLGHLFMQSNPSHNTQEAKGISRYGTPAPFTPAESILIACTGQPRTHSPQRLHVSRNDCSGNAPGGRIGTERIEAELDVIGGGGAFASLCRATALSSRFSAPSRFIIPPPRPRRVRQRTQQLLKSLPEKVAAIEWAIVVRHGPAFRSQSL